VPIVLLTLGSSQALIDALQQSPTMRESIRLIDIAQERADALSVSIADAIRGLDGEPWEHERSSTDRPELDDIGGVSKADLANLTLQGDQMSLDVVETLDTPHGERTPYDHDSEPEPVPVTPAVVAAQSAPVAAAEPAPPPLPDDGAAGAAAAEPVPETTSQAFAARPSDSEPAEPTSQSAEPEAPPTGDGVEVDESPDDAPSKDQATAGKGNAGKNGADKKSDIDKEEGNAPAKAGKGAPDADDDIIYAPVGSLIASADVLYPALDQGGAHGALRELASVLLDDGIVDPYAASDLVAAQREAGLPASARQEATSGRPGDKVVTLEDYYGACEQEGEDQLADVSVARPLHDTDL
jgi:hypothetical protein